MNKIDKPWTHQIFVKQGNWDHQRKKEREKESPGSGVSKFSGGEWKGL